MHFSKQVFTVLTLLVSTSAFAQTQVFSGNSKYTCFNDGTPAGSCHFSDLEQKGVQRTAEEKALNACEAAGATDCVILNSVITSCNEEDTYDELACLATATVRGNSQK